jgi:hypothetical protein
MEGLPGMLISPSRFLEAILNQPYAILDLAF